MARQQKAKNKTRQNKKPVYDNLANMISDAAIWRSQFNADYDQILLRISNAPTGLRDGVSLENMTFGA